MQTQITLFRFSDLAPVEAIIEYRAEFESDYYEVGEQVVWRDYIDMEVMSVRYHYNGETYFPTEEELEEWQILINKAALADFEGVAA